VSSTAALALSCRVLDDVGTLDQLAEAWDALAGPTAIPGARHAWISACSHAFHSDGSLRVVTIWRAGALVAAAPLAINPAGELEPVGMAQLYEPTEFLHADEAAGHALARALARIRRPVLVRRIATDSTTVRALTRAYARRGFVVTKPSSASPVVALDATWTGSEGGLSSGRRSDLRRARRKADAMGAVTYELRAPTVDELGPLLEEAFAIEASSWRRRSGTALALDEPRAEFLRRLAEACAAEGTLRIGLMRIDGEGAAMQVAVEQAERLWMLKIGFDLRFGRCSPGSLLLLETLRDAAARGLRACELLGTAEAWTAAWTSDRHEIVAVRAYPLHARSLIGLGGRAGRSVRRRLVTGSTVAAS
jgi:CelD/BcsL family acetyltransferase involved in cellulose biosynthesis